MNIDKSGVIAVLRRQRVANGSDAWN